jgi:hypothetical protein
MGRNRISKCGVFLKIGVAVCLLLAIVGSAWPQGLYTSSCEQDDQITATVKNTIDAAAKQFADLFLGENPVAAFDALADGARHVATPGKLAEEGRTLKQEFAPTNPEVVHTYVVTLLGKSPGAIVCGTDLSNPADWVLVAAGDFKRQAHVLMSAQTASNDYVAVNVWLVPQQDNWKVQSFWVNPSSVAGKDSIQLWNLARTQASVGHEFNAAILFSVAARIAYRGSIFKLGVAQAISEDGSKVQRPGQLVGQPPFEWQDGNTTLTILSLSSTAIGGQLYLAVAHEISPWNTDAQANDSNERVVTYIKSHFAEYSDVFRGIVVIAKDRVSTRTYRSVVGLPIPR